MISDGNKATTKMSRMLAANGGPRPDPDGDDIRIREMLVPRWRRLVRKNRRAALCASWILLVLAAFWAGRATAPRPAQQTSQATPEVEVIENTVTRLGHSLISQGYSLDPETHLVASSQMRFMAASAADFEVRELPTRTQLGAIPRRWPIEFGPVELGGTEPDLWGLCWSCILLASGPNREWSVDVVILGPSGDRIAEGRLSSADPGWFLFRGTGPVFVRFQNPQVPGELVFQALGIKPCVLDERGQPIWRQP